MTPLIRAYEERIKELENVSTKTYGMAEQAQALATENESLREELQNKTEQINQLHAQGSVAGTGDFFGRSRLDEEKEEIEQLYFIN